MNKKGVIWEEMADLLLGGMLLFVTFSGYLLIQGLNQERVDSFIQEKVSYINQGEILSSFLGANINETMTFQDMLTSAYINKDKVDEEKLDLFFENIYSSKVCWKLFKEGHEWAKKNKCKNEEDILNANISMPLPTKEVINIKLLIEGYAE
jgi:hypothetical protein